MNAERRAGRVGVLEVMFEREPDPIEGFGESGHGVVRPGSSR